MRRWVSVLKSGARRFAALFRRSGFTIALSLCLLMIGGAAYFARTIGHPPTPARSIGTPSPVVMTPESVEKLEDAQKRLQTELLWPLSGHEILAGYSETEPQYNQTLGLWEIHKGVDIAAVPGEAVLAALPGTVSASYKDALLGYTVELSHEDGYVTRYSNLKTLQTVTVGERVILGQPIGSVGDSAPTEAQMPPHLHYEAYKAGAWALDQMSPDASQESAEYLEQVE